VRPHWQTVILYATPGRSAKCRRSLAGTIVPCCLSCRPINRSYRRHSLRTPSHRRIGSAHDLFLVICWASRLPGNHHTRGRDRSAGCGQRPHTL